MLMVRKDNVGEAAIVECEGMIISGDDALTLREAVMARKWVGVIVIDLTKVWATAGKGLSTFVSLQGWARDHDIQLKWFNPRSSVRYALEGVDSSCGLEFSSLGEITQLLTSYGSPKAANGHPVAA
jgi:hypothetical protein